MKTLFAKYKTYFKEIPALYDYQVAVLKLLQDGDNTLCIIPTGGGKSLIFQLHGLNMEGVTLVVSPLLSLMSEQVRTLEARGIKVLALNSTINFNNQRKILRTLNSKAYKFIYVSPERLQNSFFRAALLASKINISFVVIDEAHCISQWGSDFRPDYSQIPEFLNLLKQHERLPQLFCLTATLSKTARVDVQKAFHIKEAQTYIHHSLLRKNFQLNFKEVKDEKEKPEILSNFLSKYSLEKIIIYLYSKRRCEELAKQFAKNYKTAYYHAGLDMKVKDTIDKDFRKGKYNLLFATTAFGMGIDIPNIDSIVQLQIPNSVEEYYQQIGRGWRDKKISKTCFCLALWSKKNFSVRIKEFEAEKHVLGDFDLLFKKFTGSYKGIKAGAVINIATDKLINASENLRLFRFKLQQKGIITPLVEVNGSPLSIKFKKPTKIWSDVQKFATEFDSFTFVSTKSNIPIREIFKHLFEQEFIGNIDKIPSLERDFFFAINQDIVSDKIKSEIIDELNLIIDFKIARLKELRTLYKSDEPEKYILSILN